MNNYCVEIFVQGQEPAKRFIQAFNYGVRDDGTVQFTDSNHREVARIVPGQYMTVLVNKETR